MAIAPTVGGAANSGASAVASLASPSITTTTGRDVVVKVVLGSTTSSVSSISTSAGSYTGWTTRVTKNGTGIRIETWTAHVATGAATVFTANIAGGNTTCDILVEEYSGVGSFGNTGSNSGFEYNPNVQVIGQDASSYVVAGFGIVNASGDTFTITAGTTRQTTVPAASGVGGNLSDTTAVADETFVVMTRLNAQRQWASTGVELIASGSAPNTIVDYPATGSAATLQASGDVRYLNVLEPAPYALAPTSFSPVPVAVQLKGGTIGLSYAETISVNGGIAPYSFTVASGTLPTGTALGSSSGIISGTPTTPGTYSFSIHVTDTNGSTGVQAFQIVIASPSSGGGAFVYVA